ncbi:hypothetical protein [Aeromonas sp. QDB03]|uniref:hypothetical protein n=1 Tax=Aeromonas sp. QDB03 TaxID=2989839 RepID=UPI0022E21DDB|nr:hypothetical protein [Aeromonas sp. QDB03]
MERFLSAKTNELVAVESMLSKFETSKESRKEKELRIGKLSRTSGYKGKLLAEKLSDCLDEEPCFSFACPECIRRFRIRKISQLVLFSEDYTAWKVATFIYYDEMVRELGHLDIVRLKNKLRKQLERAGVTDVVIGFFEVDFHSEYQRWMPHFHLLVRCKNSDSSEWKKLRNTFENQQMPSSVHIRKCRPVLFQKFKEPLRQTAYICKVMWQHVVAYYDAIDQRKTKKVRLSNRNFVDALLKLDSLRASDLEFMYRVRQHGTTLKEPVRGKK